MKTEIIIEQIERTTYVAEDGKVFYARRDCERYENEQRLKNVELPYIYYVGIPDEDYSYAFVVFNNKDEYEKLVQTYDSELYDVDCGAPENYPCHYLLFVDEANQSVVGGYKSIEEIVSEYENALDEMHTWLNNH